MTLDSDKYFLVFVSGYRFDGNTIDGINSDG